MFKQAYRVIMDSNTNPLKSLPPMVRFQLMTTLSVMWSMVFTLWIGTLWALGPTVAAHLILVAGVVFTADSFRQAQRRAATLDRRAHRRDPHDSAVRYDDLWGAHKA